MEKHITGESVKTGLQVEANNNTVKNSLPAEEETTKETDADELVHEPTGEDIIVDSVEEQDMDELVHSRPTTNTTADDDEADPDDLVHQK